VERLNAEAAARQRETAQALQRDIAAAEERIAAARTAALADLRGVATEVARAAVQKLVGIEVGTDDAGRAVDNVLTGRA
jgi:F-type H+-transporting ATPase subunit b